MLDSMFEFSRHCEEHHSRPALVSGATVLTYADYDRLVTAAADFLLTQQIAADDRIAIVSRNRLEYAIAVWAIMRLGAMACLINARLPEAAVVESLREMGCTGVLRLADDNTLPGSHDINISELPPLEKLSVSSQSPTLLQLDRPATVMLTSGTAGKPKAIIHSIGNHYYSALGSNENIEVRPGDGWLLSLPLYHVGGLSILFRCILGGAAVHFTEQPIEASVTERITHLSVVPTQLGRILDDTGLSSRVAAQLKAVLIGGAAVPRNLVSKSLDAGLPIHTSYGLTEMSSQVTSTPPGDSCESSGRLLPYRQIRLSSDSEIEVRGETRFWGTLEGGVPSPLDPMDWYPTGDIGRFDEHDLLTIVGRVDSRFKSGGETVQPELVEEALRRLERIDDAVVVGFPDDEFGFRPVALVRWSGAQVDDETIRNRLRSTLPGYAIPVAFLEWPASLSDGGIKPSRAEAARFALEMLS